jgi:hypothetical protein
MLTEQDILKSVEQGRWCSPAPSNGLGVLPAAPKNCEPSPGSVRVVLIDDPHGFIQGDPELDRNTGDQPAQRP